ncbi:MAG: cryptochrome/photolyase family protein [Chitinophagales bacterium]
MSASQKIAIHWFRRDLRFDDNTALHHAVSQNLPVLCLFIFDSNILEQLKNKHDKRVDFIYQQLKSLHEKLTEKGSRLLVKYGEPLAIWQELTAEYNIEKVFANRDYEPYAQERDKSVYAFLQTQNITFKGYKDHVIFEKNEVLKKDGKPYSIFTPYSKVWRANYEINPPICLPNALEIGEFFQQKNKDILSLNDIGFYASNCEFPAAILDENILAEYKEKRDYPFLSHTSNLSIHFRFGTISIRKYAKIGAKKSLSWLNELIWRDFYQMILFHHPRVVGAAFKPAYEAVEWQNNKKHFEAWCAGKTGYPLVDAGMRELNETGLMHNRVRMITASFLTKHLLIDWRWGEAYFAEKLLDFELASNNGGWQWAASCGCDAAPYFRIFNPTAQLKKFDKELRYVRKWITEFDSLQYPKPIVEHRFARQRAIDTFKAALQKSKVSK